ncbi:hypothetical protein Smp_161420 [Schistosoma mansoni]|uniref:hypothetical protein n=1 Tax=Schistosoma mansoni TaxID=6183 RepID=UPI0001A61C7E|nr:hypothetical protein Smp_161420 [Schistosoma mansoni]|eukprot:XP_018649293.1 hypothetical protein Smp_161420 [Schistosoma mansoni]
MVIKSNFEKLDVPKIDVIIVLQWSSTVQLSLNNLFNEIANKNLLFEKCTCLILPMIGQFKHVKFNSIQHKSIKSSLLKNDEIKEMIWLHIALKLGLTVLQVCNGNKFWTRFQYTQSMSLFASEKLYLNLYNNSQSIQKTKYNSEFLKRSLLLYEKFGVGQLKILPIPTGYVANHSSSYSVLFTWIPYETELSNIIEHHKNYVKVFFYSVTLDSKKASDSVNETQLVHHQIEIEQKLNNEAITITKSLIQQLTRYVGMNCSINKKGSNEHVLTEELNKIKPYVENFSSVFCLLFVSKFTQFYGTDVTYSQSKITRSKTFTSGLNPLKRTIYTNGVRSTTNPILRKNREQKYENDVVKSPEDNQKHKNGIKQVTFSETVKFVSTEDFVKKVTMKSSVNVNRSVTPEILPSPMVRGISTQTPLPPQTTVVNTNTTNATITTNIPESPVIVSNEKNNDEFFLQSIEECSSEGKTETLLTKSTSCPNQLAQHTLNNHSRPTSLFEKDSDYQYYYYYNSDQKYEKFPLSATVLLAIPEGGENDYYADSPQCITVKELKELGRNENDTGRNVYELDNTLPDDGTNSSSFISETVPDFTEIHIPNNISLTHHEEVMIS